jgi:group I intron endonuclease
MTCGIYRIRNLINGKVYVGSSQNIEQRWRQHRRALQKHRHHCRHLQRAWRRYGSEAFAFEVLKKSEIADLVRHEQEVLDETPAKLRYNEGPCVWPPMRGRVHTNRTKEKLRQKALDQMSDPAAREYLSTLQKERGLHPDKVARRRLREEARQVAIAERAAAKSQRAAEQMRAIWSDKESRKRRCASLRRAAKCAYATAKRSATMKRVWSDPIKKRFITERIIAACNTDESRARRSAAAFARWRRPGHREKVQKAWEKKHALAAEGVPLFRKT